jgi:carboxypeptidase C (cathepsin A)
VHSRLLLLALALSIANAHPTAVAAQQPPHEGRSGTQDSRTDEGLFSLIPADATTEHRLRTATGEIAYKATAGTLDLFGQDGNRSAKIFYTAYVAEDRSPDRPISFVFNGGPGAASAYLHLGLAGPKLLPFGKDGNDGTMPVLEDNPQSWLAFTDLVFIDPVGTGWSRASSDDAAKSFYGVRQDADSLAKAISLYVQKNNRVASPKYLVGESYGGFRAPKVAVSLKNNQGMLISGIVMLSPLLEGRFLANSDDPLSAALQLPSIAAAKLEREGRADPQAIAAAENFALREYLPVLAGPAPQGDEAAAFYRRIADLTGVPEQQVAESRGFVGDVYAKQVAGPGNVVSPYDASYVVPDAYPEEVSSRNDDPILDGYTRAYGSAFVSYARSELGFSSDMTYNLLNEEVNRRWEWNGSRGGDGRVLASVSTDIRDLLSVVPSLHLLIAHGYSDALTPYGASRYVIEHLPPALSEQRATLKTYPGGHMFYTRPDSRRAFSEDMRAFYSGNAAK